jgi:hypothetical protein
VLINSANRYVFACVCVPMYVCCCGCVLINSVDRYVFARVCLSMYVCCCGCVLINSANRYVFACVCLSMYVCCCGCVLINSANRYVFARVCVPMYVCHGRHEQQGTRGAVVSTTLSPTTLERGQSGEFTLSAQPTTLRVANARLVWIFQGVR